MQIVITNESAIQKYEETRPHIVVSIQDTLCPFIKLPENPNRLGWLGLKFSDIDDVQDGKRLMEELGISHIKLFSKEHAKSILDFYNLHKGEAEVFIVHCVAGICRSPAIGAAIALIEGHDPSEYFKKYCPNRHVHRTILDYYYEQKEKEDKTN